jgi:hypothetical protein
MIKTTKPPAPRRRKGEKYLTAHRLLIQPISSKILPILKGFAPEPNDLENCKEWANIKPLIEGPLKGDLQHKSRLELEHEYGDLGTLWSVLTKIMAPREANNAREYQQRQEKPVQMEGFEPGICKFFQASPRKKTRLVHRKNRPAYQCNKRPTQLSLCTFLHFSITIPLHCLPR